MNIPNLPTDNLYKFFAISCLFLGAIFFIVPEYLKYEVLKSQIEINSKMSKLIAEMTFYTEKYNDAVEHKNTSSINIESMADSVLNFDIQKADIDTQRKLAMLEVKLLNRLINIRNFGTSILLTLSIIGFIFWYIKVQSLLDTKLKSSVQVQSKRFKPFNRYKQ